MIARERRRSCAPDDHQEPPRRGGIHRTEAPDRCSDVPSGRYCGNAGSVGNPPARDPFSSRVKGFIAIRMVPVVGWFAQVPAYFVGVEDFAEDFAEDLLC